MRRSSRSARQLGAPAMSPDRSSSWRGVVGVRLAGGPRRVAPSRSGRGTPRRSGPRPRRPPPDPRRPGPAVELAGADGPVVVRELPGVDVGPVCKGGLSRRSSSGPVARPGDRASLLAQPGPQRPVLARSAGPRRSGCRRFLAGLPGTEPPTRPGRTRRRSSDGTVESSSAPGWLRRHGRLLASGTATSGTGST